MQYTSHWIKNILQQKIDCMSRTLAAILHPKLSTYAVKNQQRMHRREPSSRRRDGREEGRAARAFGKLHFIHFYTAYFLVISIITKDNIALQLLIIFWLSYWVLFSFYDAHNLYVQYTSRRRITSNVTAKYYVQYSTLCQSSTKLNTNRISSIFSVAVSLEIYLVLFLVIFF